MFWPKEVVSPRPGLGLIQVPLPPSGRWQGETEGQQGLLCRGYGYGLQHLIWGAHR